VPGADQRLRDQIADLIARWEPIVGVRVEKWLIKRLDAARPGAPTGYWASVDPRRGQITFSTRLADEPPDFLEFVVVHELVHLARGPRRRGHGQVFDTLMDFYLPTWRRYKPRRNAGTASRVLSRSAGRDRR
jgi:predicted metal-dependent hydrolase